MICDLPIYVDINGKKHHIRNDCDYRVVLDAICALKDHELTYEEQVRCALFIFYEDISEIEDFETAIKEMFRIINGGEQQEGDHAKDKGKPSAFINCCFHIFPPEVFWFDISI